MKIAILGTRGVPNHYGGFEQFAEYLSAGLVRKGHEVYVYNSHNHPYQASEWEGVKIIHCYDPEYRLGTAGQFIYDLNSIRDSRKRDFDVILQLGYTSSSVWGRWLPKQSVIVTNMDGMEWKRSKYSSKVQKFLRYAEKLGVQTSDYLVADSPAIQEYLEKTYQKEATFIAYGAHLFENPREEALNSYEVKAGQYHLLIARLEPENNPEAILEGATQAESPFPFLVFGNHETKYGEFLKEKFQDPRIRFVGTIFDIEVLNNLRYYARWYFHGHSVGGTNPSLLEAMASGAMICAHDNPFNRAILGEDAVYFQAATAVKNYLEQAPEKWGSKAKIEANRQKIQRHYNWPKIIDQYENLMQSVYAHSSSHSK